MNGNIRNSEFQIHSLAFVAAKIEATLSSRFRGRTPAAGAPPPHGKQLADRCVRHGKGADSAAPSTNAISPTEAL